MIDNNAYQFLKDLSKHHNFGRTLTLGRQELNNINGYINGSFAEELIRKEFKAEVVDSLDISSFENASIIHDLNVTIKNYLRDSFDVVFDGGTLEHIFNFPLAIKNVMEMVRVDGYLVLHTVTNNYCGHGFYQFSPELFYSILNETNGYNIERMVIHSVGSSCKNWYNVMNPLKINSRVELISHLPMMLLVLAKRIKSASIFYSFPLQTDYIPRWKRKETSKPKPVTTFSFIRKLKTAWFLFRNHSIRNTKYFKPV